MIQNFLVYLLLFCIATTCALDTGRYSDCMQDASQLPQEISTAHEVILVQSNALVAQKTQIDALTKEREELRAEIRFLLSGKKREKFISPDQMLIQFAEDKELQAVLEAAKLEAEKQVEEITYTRAKTNKERKPAQDSFPAHLPREVVEVPIPESFQARIDSGELVIKRYEQTETLKSRKRISLRNKQILGKKVGTILR
jgi:cell division protein FtsB